MPVIHFLGRIVPASAKHISLSYPTPTDKLQSKYVSPENDLEAALTFRIAKLTLNVSLIGSMTVRTFWGFSISRYTISLMRW